MLNYSIELDLVDQVNVGYTILVQGGYAVIGVRRAAATREDEYVTWTYRVKDSKVSYDHGRYSTCFRCIMVAFQAKEDMLRSVGLTCRQCKEDK